jgi:hypothetical protein
MMTSEQYQAAGLSPEDAKRAADYGSAAEVATHSKNDVDQLINLTLDPSQPSVRAASPDAPATGIDFTEDDLQVLRDQNAAKLLGVPMVKPWVQLPKAPILSSTLPAMTAEQYEAAGLPPEDAKRAVDYDSAAAVANRAKNDVDQLINQIPTLDPSQPTFRAASPDAPATGIDFTELDWQARRERNAGELLLVPMVKPTIQLLKLAPICIEEGPLACALDGLKDVVQDRELDTLGDALEEEGCWNPKNQAACTKMPTPQPGPTPSTRHLRIRR